MNAMDRPLPTPTPLTQPFWDACARHELVAQRCCECQRFRHYPQPMCPDCHSTQSSWERLAGTGTIYSYAISNRAFHPAWKDHAPYVIATIELDEGVRMVSDILDLAPEAVAIGQRVEVYFEDIEEWQGAIPRFRVIE